jgi:phosphatidate cytidylyltransferase
MGAELREQPRGMVGGRNLPIAIAVGVLLAALFLASLFWRAEAFALVVLLLVGAAQIEVSRVVREVGLRLLTPVMLIASGVTVAGALFVGSRALVAGTAVLLLGSVLWLLADPGRERIVETWGATALFGLWIGFLGAYGVLLVDRPDGPVVVLAVIGAAIFTDIGGYAFGVAFGRHKVAPSVSPNKSWEGLIGGLVVAALVAAIVLPLFDVGIGVGGAIGLAITCGVAAFVGDLAESMVKRELGLKDLGDLLPGHGGILDRVDGILFAMPVGYYVLLLTA